MTERPSGGNWTELRRTVRPDETALPVMAHHHFAAGPNKAYVGDEVVGYAALAVDADGIPVLSGCTRDPATARRHGGGTRVIQTEWTTIERVAALPDPAQGRMVLRVDVPGADDTFNVGYRAADGTDVWYAANVERVDEAERWAIGAGFGSAGAANGRFAAPWDVAVVANGDAWATDAGNHRIQRFDAGGSWMQTVGGPGSGSGNGQFSAPVGIALDLGGNIYVTEYGNGRVQKLNAGGASVATWGTTGGGNGQFLHPLGIAVSPAGTVYVADTENHRIQMFTGAGAFLGAWGGFGNGPGQLNLPHAVEADPAGNVWVVDEGHRVQRFDAAGVFLGGWGRPGNAAGEFDSPQGVAVDVDGNVWVSDTFNSRVQRFAPDGTILATAGAYGGGSGRLRLPRGIAVSPAGTVYVADRGNDRVTIVALVDVSGTAAGYAEFDDFTGGGTASGAVGRWGWGTNAVGSVSYPASTIGHPGILRLATGATLGNDRRINYGPFLLDQVGSAEFIFSPSGGGSSQADARVGLMDSAGSPADGAYAESLAGEGTWFLVKAVGGAKTRVDTGIPYAIGAWYRLRLRRTASAIVAATLRRQDTLQTVGAEFSGLSLSAQLLLAAQIKTTNNATKSLDIDWCELRTGGVSRV